VRGAWAPQHVFDVPDTRCPMLQMRGAPCGVIRMRAVSAGALAPAVLARVIAPTESGAVACTLWESADAREHHQSQPEHGEALKASGLLGVMTGSRSRVFEDAELTLRSTGSQ
jgi:hypothetical protein